MCMKMYLVDGMYLGNRLIGCEVYSPKGHDFIGLTEKQIISKLKKDEKVYGFILGGRGRERSS